jgi:fumarylpyruvate hydrolase
MKYVIDFPATPTLPVLESNDVFPVGRIYCVGRNYAEHAREMGHDPEREPPFFFMKPANAIVQNNGTISYPQATQDLHHEIELVVALGKGGANIPVEKALDHVWGYGVGLDMTRRDLQGEAKKMGRPWEMGKAFDNSAPCTALVPAAKSGHPSKGAIWLKVNGAVKQKGIVRAHLEHSGNDCVFVGIGDAAARGPDLFRHAAGVGPVKAGDKLEGHVDGFADLTITYAK